MSFFHHIVERPEQRRIVENIFWLLFDKGLRILVALIVTVWMARYFGPKEFGQLNFALAFVSIFTAIATLGLNSIVVRDLIRHTEDHGEILGTALILHLFGSIVAITITVIAINLIRSEDSTGRLLVTIISFGTIFQSTRVIKYWFESQVQSRYVVWVENLVIMIMSMTRVGLILFNAPLIAFAWATLFEAIASALGLIAIYIKICGPIQGFWTLSSKRAQALLRDSWPLLMSSMVVIIYMRIDQVMLGEMIGDKAVGIYSIAVRFSEIWYLIPTIIVASLFPNLVQNHKENSPNFLINLQALYTLLVRIALVAAVITTIVANLLITSILGLAYQQSAAVLSWHVWGAIFVFFGSAWSKWIVLEGLQRIATIIHLMCLISNICLNYLLIPKYGAVGAAVATTVSYGLGHIVFMTLFSSQTIAVRMFWKTLTPKFKFR